MVIVFLRVELNNFIIDTQLLTKDNKLQFHLINRRKKITKAV